MFHLDTQFLIDHWTSLARQAGVRSGIPERSSLRPDALGLRLPRVFLAARAGDDAAVRLAGTWIEAFHGDTLRNVALSSLWRSASRPMVSAALTQTVREARPVVVAAYAGSLCNPVEIALFPLRGGSGEVDRVLGLYTPLGTLSFAKDESRLLTARVFVGVGEPARATLALAAVGGRRTA